MEVTIGKLSILNHPFLNKEEKLCSFLKLKHSQYKDFIDLALIPHYSQQLNSLHLEV
jgi:hypothetical protein